MKRIPFFLVLLFSALMLQGQISDQVERAKNLPGFDNKRLHFGFTVGLNAMDLAIQRNYEAEDFLYADASEVGYGFQVSIVSDLKLADDWNLRFLPGISFSQIEVTYFDYDERRGPGDETQLSNASNPVALGPARLDFPLVFKYRAKRDQNYRPYLIGGLSFRYDLAAKRNYNQESNEYMRFKPGSLSLEFGFGVDTYLRYFKFSPEVKLSVGLNNILYEVPRNDRYPQFVTSISRITPFVVMMNFHFE